MVFSPMIKCIAGPENQNHVRVSRKCVIILLGLKQYVYLVFHIINISVLKCWDIILQCKYSPCVKTDMTQCKICLWREW